MDEKTMIDEARRYREKESMVGRGGVVVFFDGEVQGWVNKLRNPEHWQPGCIAVDEHGRMWACQNFRVRGGLSITRMAGQNVLRRGWQTGSLPPSSRARRVPSQP